MSFYEEHGALIFGTRLKRLSEKFLQDVARIYKQLDIDFEPVWFPVFYLLNERGTVTMTEIAKELKISQPAVSQLVNSLKDKKYVEFTKASVDKRKILVCFTEAGALLTEKLVPVWQSLKRAMEELLNESQNSSTLLEGLNEVETRLDEKSILDRVLKDIDQFSTKGLKVIPYKPEYKSQYRKLMFPWLVNNFDDDKIPIELINSPFEAFITKGGLINLVKVREEIVAVSVIEITGKSSAQIIYLGVDQNWEWRNIGTQLLREEIKQLSKQKVKNVLIELHDNQSNYKALYEKRGFKVNKTKKNKNVIHLEIKI